ncbi:RHS repeat-associated core domain-containing protein [Lentzea sp. BCCO 10_0856]|uniref:RHS repeat-associated core domain-containing protein n=1 Tax=Lentzea miocenica TaxID=3095431 RepID=A0ABU4T190_9PSEU|nr:RHS repeat-associated core domain-containing protein [Lentzea sp. BCCO 10_0856]MDX8031923.1 RHS repeat-associated core domain-containing protein [Lentzea sp. BCCO 10_0856]
MADHASFRRGIRRVSLLCAGTLVASLLQPVVVPYTAMGDPPAVQSGQGPVDRPMPDSVRPNEAFKPDKRPPVVPPGVKAGAQPQKLSAERWAQVPKPGAARQQQEEVFTELLLRPGFVLGDTSLVTYFNILDDQKSFDSWKVTLFDAATGTEQTSTSLSKDELERAVCGAPRKYCRSFGAADGWVLDPAKEYFVTITAVFADGREVVSAASEKAKPRTTIVPPAIPGKQAAGCTCANALGMLATPQAVRGSGVNTGTGAYSRTEQDLSMASFGVPFMSARTYSSNGPISGPFGPGWSWIYGMRVTASDEGAVVRAEDGSEALYKLVDGAFQRPPGVRSTLTKTADGWALRTPNQLTYSFDAQGRLTAITNARNAGVRLAYAGAQTGDAPEMTITDASGRVVRVQIEKDLVREISLPDGRRVKFHYENSRLAVVKDARDNAWKYGYDAAGLLTEVKTPKGFAEVLNTYDANGRVTSQKDAIGKETRFEWNAAEQEAKTTDADGVVIFDGYRGNVLIHTQRGNGDAINHRYDPGLNRNLVVNGKQNQHQSQFDAAGNPVERTAPAPFAFGDKTKYDERNNPIEHVDTRGNLWKDVYNEFNELVESTDAEGHKIRYTYDERGLLVSSTDQRGKVSRFEYVPAGKENSGMPTATISPEGRRTAYDYDKTGRRTEIVDPRGTVPGAHRDKFTTRYRYDAQDRVVDVKQPGKEGTWRTFYDELGRAKSKFSPEWTKLEFTYLDNGLLSRAEDARKRTLFTYTDAGRRKTVSVDMHKEPDITTSYTYNAKGLVSTVTSPRGNLPGANPADFTATYHYDANDNPIRISRPYPGGRIVSRDIKVDALDRTTSKVDELGKTASFDRDNAGNVTATTDSLNRTTRMDYDRNNRQTGINEARGGGTKFTYDEAGHKIKAVSATGGVTTWTYTDDGLLADATEPRGNVDGADRERFTTHREYDLAGNPSKIIDPLDNVTSYTYDANRRLKSVTDAKGRATRYTYDEDDRIRAINTPDAPYDEDDPFDHATVYEYAADGQVKSVRDPYGNRTELGYDEAARLVSSTDPLGRRTEVGYDADGNRTTTITLRQGEKPSAAERAKRTTTDHYDIVGRREKRTLGTEGPVYAWGYDAKDRISSYGDPAGVREMTYDDEDQIKEVNRVEQGGLREKFAYGYDVSGNITSRDYPDGTKITAEYDKDSRITSQTVSGGSAGSAASTWQFGYDVAGRRTSTTLPAATGLIENRVYDDAGRLTGIGTARVPSQQQTVAPQATASTGAPSEPREVSAQPGAGLAVVSWKQPASSGGSAISGYVVTAQPGGKTVAATPGATSAVVTGLDPGTAYTFTVTAQNQSASGAASAPTAPVTPLPVPQDPVSGFQLELDQVGNPTKVVTTRGGVSESVAYTYDKADRVTTACYGVASCKDKGLGRIEYEYDLLGNRMSEKRSGNVGTEDTRYEYDAASQLRKAVSRNGGHTTAVDYDYDERGNQTGSGKDKFTYNLDNTLASATVQGRTTTYAYDATGLRQTAKTGDTTQRWSWDVSGSLPQIAVDTVTDNSGAVREKRGFTYGPDDEPLALLDPASGAHPYTHDWQGGVANMLSPTGQPEWAYDYDPFGNPRVGETLKQPSAQAAPGNPLQYTGAYQDSSSGSGNYFLRARNYNPGTGRFTTTDPMPRGGAAVSPYAYADNNPLAFTDPTGMMPEGADAGTAPDPGPSPEDVAKANQLQSKSVLDIVLEAGGQILMEILGINDLMACLKGDIGACVMTVIGALPWGKIFKAKKIAEALWRAGKAVFTFFKELEWARAILRGAERAAEAAKAAAAAAAKAAAEKAAAVKAAAEAAAKKAAEEAAARARALAAKAKAATKKGAGSCKHSFPPGTLVLMADGSTKPIEQVRPGETVRSSFAQGKGAELVTHTIRTDDDKHFVTIVLADGGKVDATENHPFWSVTRKKWVEAGSLAPGELLRTSAGTYVQISAVRKYEGAQRTYDLTVGTVHAYFVLAGATPVLVHNSDTPCKPQADNIVEWVDEGGDLRAGKGPGMRQDAYDYQSSAPGARSNAVTGRGQAPYLEFADDAGNKIGAKFDGVSGNEVIDRKLNVVWSNKSADQATRQAATAAHYGLKAVWELPTAAAAGGATRFLADRGITGILVRVAS